ncbi:MAG: tetratricopeptide repeat protein [Polyangiaceae bacterium]|nr:tetratricopeptide repeat protein [Polyangiaceae bacterium]
MTDDPMREALEALDDFAREPAPAELTRARILRDLHAGERSRGRRVLWVLPAAAVLFGVSAAAAGGGLERSARVVTDLLGITERAVVLTRAAPAANERVRAVSAAASAPAVAPAPWAEPAAEAASDEPAASPSGAAGASASALPAADPADALYRAAHRAHFEQRDFGAAITAWERYLSAAPRGRFALEARYNRALCLVRLGRTGEAKTALEPFAEGKAGGYRQPEARALIDALGP